MKTRQVSRKWPIGHESTRVYRLLARIVYTCIQVAIPNSCVQPYNPRLFDANSHSYFREAIMNKMSRRDFLEVTGAGIGSLALKDSSMPGAQLVELSGAIASLYAKFLDPDRKYSVRPFWFWNGALTGEELKRQINQMVQNGVYGAYAH